MTNPFAKQDFKFKSTLSAPELLKKMTDIASEDFWNVKINLKGLVYDDGYFIFARKWQGGMLSVKGMTTAISGYVEPAEDGCTIEANLRPGIYFLVMAVLFFCWGMFIFLYTSTEHGGFKIDNNYIEPVLLTLIIVPATMGFGAKMKKERLLFVFKEVFDVQTVL